MGIVGEALSGLKLLPQWYAQCEAGRDRHLWIFGAWDGLRYSDNSRALYEYVLAHCPDVKAVWITKSPKVYEQMTARKLPVEMSDSDAGKAVQKRAGFYFHTKGPTDADTVLMRGCHLVRLWHGIPIKQGGLSLRRNTPWKRFKTAVRQIVVPWEFLGGETLTTSPFFTPFLQSSFGLREDEVWTVGYPRNDHLFKTSVTEHLITDLHLRFDRKGDTEGNGRAKLLLYMPTHRDQATREGHPFDPFQWAGFDLESLEQVLDEKNIVLLYKGHFFDRSNPGLKTSKRILTITDDDYDDMYTFIKDVDILMTDYSSVYVDFLLCRKPVILFPLDMKEFVVHSRPLYFDYSLMDGKRVDTWPELCEALRNDDYHVPGETTLRLMHTFPDGNTCRRLVDKILQLCPRC